MIKNKTTLNLKSWMIYGRRKKFKKCQEHRWKWILLKIIL